MLKVTDVDYVKDYQLLLTFNDGTRKLAYCAVENL